MSTRRGTRRPAIDGEHHVDERWMASYMDMVTVLMCLFIVLFSMSTVNTAKFEKLRESLATGFGVVRTQKIDTATGIVVPPKNVGQQGELTNLRNAASLELSELEKLEREINAALTRQGLQNTVDYTIDSRGLWIHLVGANTFFASNSDVLTPVAQRVLTAIAGPLNTVQNQLSIEGHADDRPPGPPWPTNWELSASRAVAVLRELTGAGEVAGTRVEAVAFGSEKPAASGTSSSALAENRRVDIVVVSAAPEDVRKLIPALESAEQKAEATK